MNSRTYMLHTPRTDVGFNDPRPPPPPPPAPLSTRGFSAPGHCIVQSGGPSPSSAVEFGVRSLGAVRPLRRPCTSTPPGRGSGLYTGLRRCGGRPSASVEGPGCPGRSIASCLASHRAPCQPLLARPPQALQQGLERGKGQVCGRASVPCTSTCPRAPPRGSPLCPWPVSRGSKEAISGCTTVDRQRACAAGAPES